MAKTINKQIRTSLTHPPIHKTPCLHPLPPALFLSPYHHTTIVYCSILKEPRSTKEKGEMGTQIPYILCFISVFLCFLPQSTTTDEITCTMCATCENPCQPPAPVSPPPPPPEPQCPPPPPPPKPECPPSPASSSSGIYYSSPPPSLTSDYSPPSFTYLSPPPPIMGGGGYGGGGGGSACVGYCVPPPPNSFVPNFPNYYDIPPLLISNAKPSFTTLEINPVVACFLILLSLMI